MRPRAGRWLDPHNARAVYHWILVRNLAQVASAMRDEAIDDLREALEIAVKNGADELLIHGIPVKDSAREGLLAACEALGLDRWRRARGDQALHALGHLISAQARAGRRPLAPCAWCLFLAEASASAAAQR